MYRLKDKIKSDRPPQLSLEMIYQIKKEIKECNNRGWTTKQVEELIIKKSGIKYHYTHYTAISLENGALKKKYERKVHVNTASQEEKEDFKKDPSNTCGCAVATARRWIFRNIYG